MSNVEKLLNLPRNERARRFDEMVRTTFSHIDGRDLLQQLHPRRMLDIKRRVDGVETWFEGDWLSSLMEARDGDRHSEFLYHGGRKHQPAPVCMGRIGEAVSGVATDEKGAEKSTPTPIPQNNQSPQRGCIGTHHVSALRRWPTHFCGLWGATRTASTVRAQLLSRTSSKQATLTAFSPREWPLSVKRWSSWGVESNQRGIGITMA